MTEACFCGAEKRPDIFKCEHHRFWRNGARYASLTSVINAVYPRKSWDDAPKWRVENARIRGERVDKYLTTYVSTGRLDIEPGERTDVLERLDCLIPYWDKHLSQFHFKTQQILYSDRLKVAGIADFVCFEGGGMALDLKNTAEIEKSYALQIGAYRDFMSAEAGGILHCNPKTYKREGGCRVLLSPADCVEWWRRASTWWQSLQEMEAA